MLIHSASMKTLSAIAVLSCLTLAGCATPYGPRQFAGGYSEVHVQNDVFRILVDGNALIHKSQIEYYALVRAAELTVKQGGISFVLLAQVLTSKRSTFSFLVKRSPTATRMARVTLTLLLTRLAAAFMPMPMAAIAPTLLPLSPPRQAIRPLFKSQL
jgi:hypothetical protein